MHRSCRSVDEKKTNAPFLDRASSRRTAVKADLKTARRRVGMVRET
jgi:hypothetical protein